jgi:hypothetical protein
LLGKRVCTYGPWFKTHHKGLPPPKPDYTLPVRLSEHAERVFKLADTIRGARYSLTLENENAFRVRRANGLTLGGRPDLVCWNAEGEYTVYDVKTGAKKDSDIIQVMLYMALLPYSSRFKGKTFAGSIVSNEGGYVNIPATAVDDAFRKRIGQVLDVLGSPAAPEKRPSKAECRFCDVTAADCTERSTTERDWLPGEEEELPF